ncbi:MAG: FAD-dependent thymidylate synthase [Clostridiales bacterium]|nr:FAD-dependent thymidylate synthase [Clostridiales bacterium]
MPEAKLQVTLLSHTPDPEKTCALAARTCYSALEYEELRALVEEKDQAAFLRRIVASGHLSVLEHASFTFGVSGVSRALLAQVTRHRIASFSVQSQRYVSLDKGFGYIVPPRIKALGEAAEKEFARQMDEMQRWYVEWQEKLGGGEGSNEDARFVLPNACETHITMTMNARELLHFFSLRCCSRAQWEIRNMAVEMLRLCKQIAPVIFENAGPGCVGGPCPEGAKSCGKAMEMREMFKAL